MTACADMQTVWDCNRLAYEQAPLVRKERPPLWFNRCVSGMDSPGMQSRRVGLSANPFFCEQWPQETDENADARRAIFEACRKGQIATDVTVIQSTP